MSQNPTETVIKFVSCHRRFSLEDIVKYTGRNRRRLFRVLKKFCSEGFLQVTKEESIRPAAGEFGPCRKNPHYERIKDISLRQKKQRPLSDRDKMWRTIRYLKKFKRSDLIRLTGCNEGSVSGYTRKLVIHGYLKELGRSGKEKVFFLFNNQSPKRPIIAGE